MCSPDLRNPARGVPSYNLRRSLDLVQRPVEAATPIHVLTPSTRRLDVHRALLVAFDVRILGGAKSTKTHHGHHSLFVVAGGIHPIWLC